MVFFTDVNQTLIAVLSLPLKFCSRSIIFTIIHILQDCVTIVDSPGVGESDELTDRLMEYLPRAAAFIYVINSSNAGGVQEDRVRIQLFYSEITIIDHSKTADFLIL